MTQTTPANADLSIDEMPWPELIDRRRPTCLMTIENLNGEETQP